MDWMGATELADLAGASARAIQKAIHQIQTGHTSLWRGAELDVRVRHGQGGRSGIQYEVRVSSLPYQLQQRFNDHLKALEISIKATGDKAQAERNWRLNTIYPALKHARGSNERAAAVKAIAADRHIDLHGKAKKLSVRALYEWIKDYERTGTIAALSRTKRVDAGVRRCLISKVWDATVPFGDELKAEIANNTINIIRGYIAKGLARSKVRVLTCEYLANATRDNGFRIKDPDRIAHICRIPDRLIQEQRSYKNIYDLNYDAKRAHDKKPRIRRTIGDISRWNALCSMYTRLMFW